MTYRRLKKPVVYTIYAIGFILIISSIFLIQKSLYKKPDTTEYVNKTIFEDTVPVVSDTTTNNNIEQIANPYIDESVSITKKYYDYASDENEQKNSIIYYEGTYIPSTGITYKGKDTFDIVAILSGTVTSVHQDEILGNVIEIKHENNIVSIYQSLGEVSLKENDQVTQGQVIGKSGNSNIDKDSGNHLYFEISINNKTVNPLNYIGKKTNEI